MENYELRRLYKKPYINSKFKFHQHKSPAWISNIHCVKSVSIQSYSGPYFPAFWLNREKYSVSFIFFYLGFLSRTFANHRLLGRNFRVFHLFHYCRRIYYFIIYYIIYYVISVFLQHDTPFKLGLYKNFL